MIKISFTKKELELLANHWHYNLNYGWEGTFGGHNQEDKEAEKEYKQNIKLAEKIEKKLLDNLN